jgi:hypothetical protein
MPFSAGARFFDSRRFFVVSFAVFCHFASLAISAFPLATLYAEAVKFIFAMILKPPSGDHIPLAAFGSIHLLFRMS